MICFAPLTFCTKLVQIENFWCILVARVLLPFGGRCLFSCSLWLSCCWGSTDIPLILLCDGQVMVWDSGTFLDFFHGSTYLSTCSALSVAPVLAHSSARPPILVGVLPSEVRPCRHRTSILRYFCGYPVVITVFAILWY